MYQHNNNQLVDFTRIINEVDCIESLLICIWIKNQHIWRNEIDHGGISTDDCIQTDKVNSSLEKRNFCFFSFSSFTIDFKICYTLDILIHYIVHLIYFDYTLPILQNFEITICVKKLDWTSFKSSALKFFQNFHSPFMQLFLKDCITCSSELYMQSFSVTDLYRIAYEVCMNLKQIRHAFVPKTGECKFEENYVRLTENWSWIKSIVLVPSIPWNPNLDKTVGNISFLQISSFFIHMHSFFNLTCTQKFSYSLLRWSSLFWGSERQSSFFLFCIRFV